MSKRIGDHAELLALNYLKEQGLTLISRQFHSRFGEIDLIMREQLTFVAVEVKYRKNADFGYAHECVSPKKLAKMRVTFEYFAKMHGLNTNSITIRLDVVAFTGSHVTWLKNVA